MNDGDVKWLKAEADRCRRLAKGQSGPFAAELIRFAAEYDAKAMVIERTQRSQ